MIAILAEKIAISIKAANREQTVSIPVMKFALILIINTILTIVLSLIIGVLSGKGMETLIVLLSFISLRFFSGGYHFKSAILCTIISSLIVIIIPHIKISDPSSNFLLVVSLILVLLFAPSNIHNVARIPEKYFILLKFISFCIICSEFYIHVSYISIAFFIQSLTLIPLKGVKM